MPDTYVVAKVVPFHSITDEPTKLLPDAVTVRAALPAIAEFGFTLLSTGTGF